MIKRKLAVVYGPNLKVHQTRRLPDGPQRKPNPPDAPRWLGNIRVTSDE